jgi:hypothetical protein
MAMRETVRSLRTYFVIVAVLSGAMNLAALVRPASGLDMLISLIGLGFALAYFYLGVRLKVLLVSSPQQITGVLIAGAVFLVLLLGLGMLSGLQGGLVAQVILGLLITWYLFVNVKRLAVEARTSQVVV